MAEAQGDEELKAAMSDDGLQAKTTKELGYLHPETARLLARVVGMMAAYEVERPEIHRFVMRCSRLGPEEAEKEAQLFFAKLFEAVHNGCPRDSSNPR